MAFRTDRKYKDFFNLYLEILRRNYSREKVRFLNITKDSLTSAKNSGNINIKNTFSDPMCEILGSIYDSRIPNYFKKLTLMFLQETKTEVCIY